MSATAMRGKWLAPMLEAIHGATLVSLQPGLDTPAFLNKHYPAELTVFGAIGFISYQAPLEGETLEQSIAYWFPPLSSSPFSGPKETVNTIVKTLKKGGCPAKKHRDASEWAAVPTAILMPHLAALEATNWSFSALRNSALLAIASKACRQAIEVIVAQTSSKKPLIARLISPWLMRLILRLAPLAAPFNLETYIRYHFTKVGDQTRYLVRDYAAKGRLNSLPVDALEALEEEAWLP